jgi:hypothetical protein
MLYSYLQMFMPDIFYFKTRKFSRPLQNFVGQILVVCAIMAYPNEKASTPQPPIITYHGIMPADSADMIPHDT